MKDLIFCPIRIKNPQVALPALREFTNESGFIHWSNCWQVAPIVGFVKSPQSWKEAYWQKKAWQSRYSTCLEEPLWTEGIESYFPDLRDFFMMLPFTRINYCVILKQILDIPAHFDLDPKENEQLRVDMKPLEPLLYKLKYQSDNRDSFYLCPTINNQQNFIFPNLPFGNSVFAISESHCKHGARKVEGQEKYMISIFGNIDSERHEKLIDQSRKAYERFTIYI